MEENKCCICGNKTIETNNTLQQEIFHCKNCNLFWSENNELKISEKAEYKAVLDNLNELRLENYTSILQYLQSYLSPGAKGLEVGCASGLFMKEALKKGYIMFGIEPMKDTYTIAKNAGLNVYHGYFPQDIKNIGLKELDFIIFNDVFEHIPDITEVIEYTLQLLKPSGLLIINIPMSTGILFRIARILEKAHRPEYSERLWQFKTESPHIYYFDQKNLRMIMEKNGFQLKKYFRVKTFKVKGLQNRIEAIFVHPFKAKVLASLLTLGAPLFHLLPNDTGCFIFKKIEGGH